MHASADGLSERMLAHAADVFALTAGAMTRNSADVENLASMLRRSFLMITQLSDALIAPERVAAAAESAAWEVSEARRNAPVEPEAFALYRADRLARGLAL